jgi:hypothetical protein
VVERSHLYGLAACELARTYPDGRVRVTGTGEESLDLDVEGAAVLESERIPPDV